MNQLDRATHTDGACRQHGSVLHRASHAGAHCGAQQPNYVLNVRSGSMDLTRGTTAVVSSMRVVRNESDMTLDLHLPWTQCRAYAVPCTVPCTVNPSLTDAQSEHHVCLTFHRRWPCPPRRRRRRRCQSAYGEPLLDRSLVRLLERRFALERLQVGRGEPMAVRPCTSPQPAPADESEWSEA